MENQETKNEYVRATTLCIKKTVGTDIQEETYNLSDKFGNKYTKVDVFELQSMSNEEFMERVEAFAKFVKEKVGLIEIDISLARKIKDSLENPIAHGNP